MITPDEIWDKCLPRLRRYYGTTNNVEAIAEFVNASPNTVFDWLGGQRATGERLLKLWFFLRAVGMRSSEFSTLDKYNLYIGELYAFGVVDVERLLEILNVKQTGAVYDTIRGRSPMHPTFLLEDLRPMYDAQLAAAKRRVTKLRHLSSVSSESQSNVGEEADHEVTQPEVVAPEIVAPAAGPSVDHALVIDLAGTLQTSLVLLRFLDSDECSAETRATVLRLSGDLSEFSKLTEGILRRQVN